MSAIGHVDEATLRSPSRISRSNVRSGNLRRLHDLSSAVAGGFSLLRRLHDLLSACRIRASDGSRLVRSFDGLHKLLSAVASRATASSFPPTPSRRDQTLTNLSCRSRCLRWLIGNLRPLRRLHDLLPFGLRRTPSSPSRFNSPRYALRRLHAALLKRYWLLSPPSRSSAVASSDLDAEV